VTRALTVVQLLPALQSGGVERSTLEIGASLAQAGHRSVVISAGGRLVPRLEAGGSEHIELDIGRKSLSTLTRVGQLRRLLAGIRPDIVHARSRLPAWLAWLALCRWSGPRPHFVTTVHGLNSPGRYSAIMTRGERVIAVSETVRSYLAAHYPQLDAQRVRVIPRGVDPEVFVHGLHPEPTWRGAFETEFPMLAGGRLLTMAGRGTRLKGHADAIELLGGLRAAGIDARLLLLGAVEPGRERYLEELRQRAAALGVGTALALSPPRADVREVLASSALVLQLSRKPEAFGRGVVEALSLGRPLLGYAHGGVGELLHTHFPEGAVPLDDRDALLAAAQRLLEMPTPLPPMRLPTLHAMQAATLTLYRELADG
jgi:glycosyltransferase involved in cell wall biosynthesis